MRLSFGRLLLLRWSKLCALAAYFAGTTRDLLV